MIEKMTMMIIWLAFATSLIANDNCADDDDIYWKDEYDDDHDNGDVNNNNDDINFKDDDGDNLISFCNHFDDI